MIGDIVRLLRSSRWFLLMSSGYLLTSIGSGLTQLVVYGELALRGATPVSFAVTFVLSLSSSLVALRLGQAWLRRSSPFAVLAACELVGLAGVALPWVGISTDSELLLVVSTLLPGAAVGAGVPAYSLLIKRGFGDREFATVAAVESIGLSANVLIGAGLGSLLFPFVARSSYLAIDALTYLAAAALIVLSGLAAAKSLRRPDQHDQEASAAQLASARAPLPRVYGLIPWVAAVTAPALALLPAAGASMMEMNLFGAPVNAVLILLFARGLSQLIGPALFPKKVIDTLYREKTRMVAMALAFMVLYLLAFSVGQLLVCAACVLAAHVFAYAMTATAQTGLFKEHCESAIVPVSIRTYQAQLVVISVTGLSAGLVAERTSASTGVALSFAVLVLAGVAWHGTAVRHFVSKRRHA